MQADIFKRSKLTLKILDDDEDACDLTSDKSIFLAQQSPDPGKYPGLARDLTLLSVESFL